MVSGYFVFTIFLLVLIYNVSTGNNQFATTASVIRQIWTGRCRSCPHSTYSGFSGLSGEIDANQRSNLVGTSHNQSCVCDSCPCALVENLLTKCSPVTGILQETSVIISHQLSNLFSAIEDLYGELTRVLECGGTCQRQAQLIDLDGCTSAENFSFANQGTAKKQSTGNLQAKKSSISFKINPEGPIIKDEPTKKKDQEPNISMKPAKETSKRNSETTLKPSDSVSTSYCSKCKEKSKTCSSGCPKSKKK